MTERQNAGPNFSGRVRGLLHGVAFGDAIGAPVEKLSAAQIREQYGWVDKLDNPWHRTRHDPAGGNGRVRGNGIVTDDTLMTLSLMAIYNDVGRHLDAWDMANGMVRQIAWEQRYVPELQRVAPLIDRLFYPEKWIFQRHQLAGCDPRQGGIGNMVNCGAAMYIAPVGIVNACDPQAAYDEAIAFASGHQQSYGLEAAGVLAGAIAAAFIPDATIETVADQAYQLAKDGTRGAIGEIIEAATILRDKGADYQEVIDTFHQRIWPFSPLGDDIDRSVEKVGIATANYQPSRLLSIEELPFALGFAIMARGDFRSAVEAGINSGRDADSIGVMTGALLGALHGEAVIDPAEATQIDSINRFDLASEAATFARTAEAILVDDAARRRSVMDSRTLLLGETTPSTSPATL